METLTDSAQFPTFPQRKASLRRWASRETLKMAGTSINALRSQSTSEAALMAPELGLKDHPTRKEPHMRVRTDGKLIFPAWPALKSSSPRNDRAPAAGTATSLEEPSPTMKSSSFGLRHMLPGASWSGKRKDALMSRRKPSVSDVAAIPMTTVQEMCLDSPTIPGHLPGRPVHPGIERSLSVPDHALHRLSEEVNDRTPRASEFPVLNDDATLSSDPETGLNGMLDGCTFWAPRDLSPLIIPKIGQPEKKVEVSHELPPEVPPKSPRTESRASPRLKKTPHSANSSISTLHSAASSSSDHSIKDHSSTRPLQTHRTDFPPSNLTGMENVVGTSSSSSRNGDSPSHPRSLENMMPRAPATPWTRIGRSQSPSLASPPSSRKSSKSPTINGHKAEKPGSNLSASHQRGRSEPLPFDQGNQTPTSRKDITSIHGLMMSTIENVPEYYIDNFDLPSGCRAIDAMSKMTDTDAKSLKKQAVRHAERFEVLPIKDVGMLSQELELLDERCEYLQSTHRSLRQGRRNLHNRMISYLKSPRMANFSRERILKQEEALAELDLSIDDWVAKLETAEERRTTIRQKLLQHVAAALTLQTVGMPRPTQLDEPTPPVSPEKTDDFFSSKRKDVESIRIYADEGVAALLAEIEKEIEFIAEPGQLV